MDLLEKIKNLVSSKSVDEIMYENLKRFYGYAELDLNYEELCERYLHEQFNENGQSLAYFKENITDIQQNIEHYEKIYRCLEDDKSKSVYVNMMAAKLFMDMQYIAEAFNEGMSYFSKEVFSFQKGEVYIDCGGYDGDTAIDFFRKVSDVEHIYIFEAADELVQQCKIRIEKENLSAITTIIPKAVYSDECNLFFNVGERTDDGKIDDTGTICVEGIALDHAIKGPVTFIKMDIEGSEKEAIIGAQNIIRQYSPKMAICIYHLKDDFWKIPELIMSINSGYRFKIRQCDSTAFSETILYCIPEDMGIPTGEMPLLTKDQMDLAVYKMDRKWFLQQMRYLTWRIHDLDQWNKQLLEGKTWLEEHSKNQERYIHELLETQSRLFNEVDKKEKGIELLNSKLRELVELGTNLVSLNNEEVEKPVFDTVVSLGYNCEVSYRIKDVLGGVLDSYPFSWAYITEPQLFISCLWNLEDMLSHEIELLPWGMFMDKRYQISFHGKTPISELFDENGNAVAEKVAITLDELKLRMNYLSEKFRGLLESDKQTLFVLKTQTNMDQDALKAYVEGVYEFLKSNYKREKFVLLLVMEKTNPNIDFIKLALMEKSHIEIRVVKEFAPDSDTEKGGDIAGWIEAIKSCGNFVFEK